MLSVHAQVGMREGPVPVEEIARALDIEEIRKDTLDGFEGMLLTDRRRNRGKILVNTRHGSRRARFSTAHELGHFLLEDHELTNEPGFRCSGDDMRERRAASQHKRQEAEANRFAIDLLAPAYQLSPHIAGNPDLQAVALLSQQLDISHEATARRFIELHEQPLALIFSQDHVVRYALRNGRFLPWVKVECGRTIPSSTQAHKTINAGKTEMSRLTEATSAAWLRDPNVDLHEQTRLGARGHATTLLWARVA